MYKFTKNKPWYWAMLIVGYALIALKYFDLSFFNTIDIVGYTLLLTVWLICLIDMIKNKLFNKVF